MNMTRRQMRGLDAPVPASMALGCTVQGVPERFRIKVSFDVIRKENILFSAFYARAVVK